MTKEVLQRCNQINEDIKVFDDLIRIVKNVSPDVRMTLADRVRYNKVECSISKELAKALTVAFLEARDKLQEEFDRLGNPDYQKVAEPEEEKKPSLLERIQSWINEHF